ncbi:hypothetical protein FKR81_17535 [Lentzea tibetensis]|uniref:AAA+ ATPase domain-containing protein n=1 Tax=Lentzea tibetensis TaxID=2591470 RepID=A0A563ETM9_9PSEU|nr:hypothetical protein [Lentzea tibetensis]TWP50888.1 hypothetical protein FKR81_17535 [Lentzea tibetensis]
MLFPSVTGQSRVLLDALIEGPKSTAELSALLGTRHVATYVLRLRKALGSPELVRTTFTGYELELPHRPAPVFQLPAPVAGFVGRADELRRVHELVPSGPVVISGPPGIGKTALATVAGHALADLHPGGQLYVNLRGHSPEPPLTTAAVLSRFLRALGVRPDRIPVDPGALGRTFRELVRGTRLLVLLDNAASVAQVKPLLPDDPGCGVLITSRADLSPFDGVRLGVLRPAEAAELLGGDDELARWCGYYPLALRIALGNLVGRADTESYVDELRDDRLAALAVDGDTEVRRAFDLSYAALSPDEARLFGLLGVVPGPDFDVHAAVALLEADRATTRTLLDRLVSVNLVQPQEPGRYGLHDLLRDYAAEKVGGADDARLRLLRWYVATTHAAAGIVYPELTGPGEVPLSAAVPELPDTAAAVAWLGAERLNVIAAVHHCATNGPVELTWQLIDTVGGFFGAYGHTAEFVATAEAALGAARATGHSEAEGAMLILLAGAHYNRGELRRALELFREADRLGATARNPWVLGFCCVLELGLGELDAARATIECGAVAAPPDIPFPVVHSTFARGALARLTGDLDAAVTHQRAALRLAESHGLSSLRAAVLIELGRCLAPAEAIPFLREAVETAGRLGVTRLHADALSALAIAQCGAGDVAAARESVTLALDDVTALGSTTRVESGVHYAHGVVLAALGSSDEAEAAFTLALDMALTAESPHDAMRAQLGLGDADAATALAQQHGFAVA